MLSRDGNNSASECPKCGRRADDFNNSFRVLGIVGSILIKAEPLVLEANTDSEFLCECLGCGSQSVGGLVLQS